MKKIITILILAAGILIIKDGFTYQTGIANKTAAPGENACTVGCHNSYTLNSGPGSIVIACPTLTNWNYVPGTTYPISVTVSQASVNKYGFDFEALQTSGANAGTIQVTNSTETKTLSGTVLGNVRTTITHKAVATSTGAKTFNFNWIAPSTNIGTITFYAAGVCANGNGNNKLDYVYTTSQVVTPVTAGFAELQGELKNVTVFPNPATDFVNVHFKNKQTQAIKIELFEMNGKFEELLYNNTEDAGMQMFRFNFDNKYATGIYLLKIIAGSDFKYKKIYISNVN